MINKAAVLGVILTLMIPTVHAQDVNQKLIELERRILTLEKIVSNLNVGGVEKPLSESNMDKAELHTFVSTALISSLTLDYINASKQAREAEKFYTEAGKVSYNSTLRETGIVKKMQSEKLVIKAIPTSMLVIMNEGVQSDRYYWTAQIPMTVTYHSSTGLYNEYFIFTVALTRQDSSQYPAGVAIEQLTFKRGAVQGS